MDCKPFGHNMGFTLQLFTEYAFIFMWITDTVIVGKIIKITFRITFKYEMKYIIKKDIKKIKGPSIDPSGTPLSSSVHSLFCFPA